MTISAPDNANLSDMYGRRDCLLAMNIGSTESDKRYEVVLKHYSAAFTRCYAVQRKSEVGIAGFAVIHYRCAIARTPASNRSTSSDVVLQAQPARTSPCGIWPNRSTTVIA
jgi:hypothetical protein